MAEVFLGSVYAVLELRTEKWNEGLAKAQSSLDSTASSFGSKMNNVASSMESIGSRMTVGLTLPITLFAKQSVDAAVAFDKVMRQIGVASGEGEAAIQRLRPLIEDFGKKGVFSMTTIAEAVRDMVKDGLTPAEIATGQLDAAFNLATASGEDLYASQVVLSNAMAAYGADVTDAAHFSDVLNNALVNSQADLADLAEAMKYVAPVSAAMGMSIEETAGAIATLSQYGIKGSQAGTALRRAMIRLADPTAEAKSTMDELGLTFFDSSGKMKSFQTIVEETGAATAKLTQEEKAQSLSRIFGLEGLTAMIALTKDQGVMLKDVTATMGEQGTAAKNAELAQQGLAASSAKLTANMDRLKVLFGEALAPAIGRMADAIGFLADSFQKLSPGMRGAVASFAMFIAAIGPVLVGLAGIIRTVTWVSSSFKILGAAIKIGPLIAKLGGAMSGLWAAFVAGGPVVWVIVAVLLVLAGIAYLVWKNWDKIKPKLEAFWTNIQTKWQAFTTWASSAFDGIKEALGGIVDGVQEKWAGFVTGATTIWTGLVTFFTETLPTKIMEGWAIITTFFTTLPTTMWTLGVAIIQGLVDGIVNSIANILFAIGFIVGLFIFGLPAIYEWLVTNVPIWWQNFVMWIINIGPAILAALLTWYNQFILWGQMLWMWMSVEIPRMFTEFLLWIAMLAVNTFVHLLMLYQQFVNWGTMVWAYLSSEVPRMLTEMVAWFAALPGRIWTWLQNLYSKVVQWGAMTWAYLSSAIPMWFNQVVQWFAELPGRVFVELDRLKVKVQEATENAKNRMKEIVDGWISVARSWGESIARAFADGFSAIGKWIAEKVQAGLDAAKGMIKGNSPPKEGPFKHIDQWGFNVAQAWVDGFALPFDQLQGILGVALPQPAVVGMGSYSGQVTPAPSFAGGGGVTNAPVYEINIGMYAGSEIEKREIARQLHDARMNYEKGQGNLVTGT